MPATKEAIAHIKRNPSPEPDVVDSIQILRGLDRGDGEEHPVIFADRQR